MPDHDHDHDDWAHDVHTQPTTTLLARYDDLLAEFYEAGMLVTHANEMRAIQCELLRRLAAEVLADE